MSDFLAETPVLGRRYCPPCEPEADPIQEILWVQWCPEHYPSCTGAADPVQNLTTLDGNSFDAETNRRICALLAGRDA